MEKINFAPSPQPSGKNSLYAREGFTRKRYNKFVKKVCLVPTYGMLKDDTFYSFYVSQNNKNRIKWPTSLSLSWAGEVSMVQWSWKEEEKSFNLGQQTFW